MTDNTTFVPGAASPADDLTEAWWTAASERRLCTKATRLETATSVAGSPRSLAKSCPIGVIRKIEKPQKRSTQRRTRPPSTHNQVRRFWTTSSSGSGAMRHSG